MERTFDKIKLNDGMVVTISDDKTIIKTEVGGRTYNFDVSKATPQQISDFMAGVGYGRAVSSNLTLSSQNQDNSYRNDDKNYNTGMSSGNQNTNSKVLALNNGHYKSSDMDRMNMPYQNPNGFTSKILVTSLSGFMIGVIIAIIYIFINIGKISFTL